LLAVYVLLCSASGFAIYPSLDFKVVKNGNLNREGYILNAVEFSALADALASFSISLRLPAPPEL
jgi:hypothetical protein